MSQVSFRSQMEASQSNFRRQVVLIKPIEAMTSVIIQLNFTGTKSIILPELPQLLDNSR